MSKKETIKNDLKEVLKKYDPQEFYEALESLGKELRLTANKGITNKVQKWAMILK